MFAETELLSALESWHARGLLQRDRARRLVQISLRPASAPDGAFALDRRKPPVLRPDRPSTPLLVHPRVRSVEAGPANAPGVQARFRSSPRICASIATARLADSQFLRVGRARTQAC